MVWDRQADQFCTAGEGFPADFPHTVRDLHRGESAPSEGILRDLPDTIGDPAVFYLPHIGKGAFPYAAWLFPPGAAAPAPAVLTQTLRQIVYGFYAIERRSANIVHTVRDLHILQRPTVAEGLVMDLGQVPGQMHPFQTGTIAKCSLADTGNTVRDLCLPQLSASTERAFPNGLQGIRETDRFQRSMTLEHIVCNGSTAGSNHHMADPVRIPMIATAAQATLPLDIQRIILQTPEQGVLPQSAAKALCDLIGSVLRAPVVLGVEGTAAMDVGNLIKGIGSNFCHAFRNGKAGQAGTAGEGIPANFRHTVRDLNTGQAAAAAEGTITNFSDAIGKMDAGQTAAAIEGTVINANDPLRKLDAGQTAAAAKGISSNFSNTFREPDTGQTAAAVEGTPTDPPHLIRDRNTGKAPAAQESKPANQSHIVRNRDTGQAGAARE